MKNFLCFCVTVFLCAAIAALHHRVDFPIVESGLRIEVNAAEGLASPMDWSGMEAGEGHLINANYRPEMSRLTSVTAAASRTDIQQDFCAAGGVMLACRDLPATADGQDSSMAGGEVRAALLYRR